MEPALLAPPAAKTRESQQNWRQLKAERERKTGKEIKSVKHRSAVSVPSSITCEKCGAPSGYLYLNNGKTASQIRCKICGSLGPTHRRRRESVAKYFCPHCGKTLYKWKGRAAETIFKCHNNKCLHYLVNLNKLTPVERAARVNIYNPNYKLRYQYREYHLNPKDLKPSRPKVSSLVDLRRVHNTYHVVGLTLSLFVNLGLSARQTRDALRGLFGITISRQTVINYVNAAAALLSDWVDRASPTPTGSAAGDETYIIVNGFWRYTWFIIDTVTRAICGYNLSTDRGTVPALATLYDAYGAPRDNAGSRQTLTADGLPSYDSATMAYNQGLAEPKIIRKTVVGLENRNAESKEFRPFKQIVERLNRTYKFHTRPRAGFKTFDGAVSLTTLFVAYYNFLRPHSALRRRTPVALDCLKGAELFPKQWEILLEKACA